MLTESVGTRTVPTRARAVHIRPHLAIARVRLSIHLVSKIDIRSIYSRDTLL